MKSDILYEVKFQPWDRSWLLSGPVGATGKLSFQSAKYAASHARWVATTDGGTIKVHSARSAESLSLAGAGQHAFQLGVYAVDLESEEISEGRTTPTRSGEEMAQSRAFER